jgi:hypothetical protein
LRDTRQDRQLGDARFAGARRQSDNEISQILKDPVDDVELGRPQVNFGSFPR